MIEVITILLIFIYIEYELHSICCLIGQIVFFVNSENINEWASWMCDQSNDELSLRNSSRWDSEDVLRTLFLIFTLLVFGVFFEKLILISHNSLVGLKPTIGS